MKRSTDSLAGWLLVAAAVLAFVVAVYDYFLAWGIRYSIGSMIVLVSTLLMSLAAAVLVWTYPPRSLRILLGIGLVVDFLGTALAAYFLESYLLTGLSLLAGVAWLVFVIEPGHELREQRA